MQKKDAEDSKMRKNTIPLLYPPQSMHLRYRSITRQSLFKYRKPISLIILQEYFYIETRVFICKHLWYPTNNRRNSTLQLMHKNILVERVTQDGAVITLFCKRAHGLSLRVLCKWFKALCCSKITKSRPRSHFFRSNR